MEQSMAQKSNVEIPARFIFRPYGRRWVKCLAEIVGWCEETSTPAEFRHPPVELGGGKRTDEDARAKQTVLLKLNVPSAGGSEATGIYPLAPSYTVEVLPSHLPAEVLQAHENRQNSPNIAGRTLIVLACPMPELGSILGAPAPKAVERDAWVMRDEFLNLKQDMEALRLFLNHWGLWDRSRGYEVGFLGEPHGFAMLFPHLLWERQEEYRKALTGKARKWLSTTSSLFLSYIKEPPYFVVRKSHCEDAIRSTITIDHLLNITFGICKRYDCRKLFERTTQQRRFYCSHGCAHVASVRKQRADKKKLESKGRKRATRKT
jgi:hypothetical protein